MFQKVWLSPFLRRLPRCAKRGVTRVLRKDAGDGIENGGFSSADDEISREGMAKGLFQSRGTSIVEVGRAHLMSFMVTVLSSPVAGALEAANMPLAVHPTPLVT